MKSKILSLAICSFFIFFISCSSSKSGVVKSTERNELETGFGNTLSLRDYLVRLPNLYWQNNRIMLRETSSITAQQEPLYIVDGVNVGNSYSSAASFIDPNDIKSVRVLTSASETSIYGLNGSGGVILIKSKK